MLAGNIKFSKALTFEVVLLQILVSKLQAKVNKKNIAQIKGKEKDSCYR